MNPIFRIVNYLFKIHDQINTDNSFDSFFGNGTAFPHFIQLIFNKKIPGIISNPKNDSQKYCNNEISLKFLFQNNHEISMLSPDFKTKEDQFNLLKLILTKQVYTADNIDIMNKCNFIVRSLNIYYGDPIDLINMQCILNLLNILTEGKIKINTGNDDFDQIMITIFEIANVPLVIDKTSLENENNFTFYIQILIIFDTFSDKIKQLEELEKNEIKMMKELQNKDISTLINEELNIDYSDSGEDHDQFKSSTSHQTNRTEISEIEKEKLNDESLLNTINVIGAYENLHIDNFLKIIDRDNIIKFVKIFLKDKDDFLFLSKLISKVKPYDEKINELIKFLGEKEPIFKTLLFNFKDQKLKKTSISLFFTQFLNCFFLKQAKPEMLERVKILLFTKINEQDTLFPLFKKINKYPKHEEKLILLNWNVFLNLVYFVNTGKIHFNIKEIDVSDYSFNKKSIPQIINEKHLNQINDDFSTIYYQLQFIFNAIDNAGYRQRFIEIFLKNIRKINKVNVPKFNALAASIIPINIALIEQDKRYSIFSRIEKSLKSMDHTELNVIKPQKNVETFEQRQFQKSLKLQNFLSSRETKGKKIKPAEEYWNPIDKTYSFKNGFLFEKQSNKAEEWNDVLNSIKVVKPKNQTNKSEMIFSDVQPQNRNFKLYKFFIYDEQNNKWEKNSSSIHSFLDDMKIPQLHINTSLVLFSNSSEKDLITLNSKLINCLFPKINECDDIFVYALFGKSLALLKYNINFSDEMNCSKKPIFLLLHVPENKMKLNHISTIINQIYYFLSIICDIEIVVLNKDHCNSQISFIERIKNIKSSYEKSIEEKIQLRNQPAQIFNIQFNNDDLNFSSDDDDKDDENDEESDNIQNDIFSRMNLQIFKKEPKFIILFNSEAIHGDYERYDQIGFFINIKNQISKNNCFIHFININEAETYRDFLTSFYNLVSINSTECEELFERFDFYEMSHISGIYFQLKNTDKWQTRLNKLIRKRFKQFENLNFDNLSDFENLSKLSKEIIATYPSIDKEFGDECNLIISKIRDERTQKKKEIFKEELQESSRNNLLYLTNVINSKDYWSCKSKENVKNSHENFLKNEFFNIIKTLYSKKDCSHIFKGNYSILEEQIRCDRKQIDELFFNFETKQENENTSKIVGLNEQRKRGTNFMIRERENVREIKIIVEAGHTDDVIESDF